MAKETNLKSWVGISLFLLVMVSTADAETTSLDANYADTSLVINSDDTFITNGYDVNIGTGGITIKSGGILDANSGAGGDSLITLEGDWSNSGTFAAGSSTVTFDGASSQLIITGGTDPNKMFNHVRVTGVGVEIDLFGQTLAGDFVFESTGSSRTNSQDVNVAGSLVINSGTLDANASNLYVGGNWTNNDTFSPGTSTVSFTGDSNSTIGGTNATTFHYLKLEKADGNNRLSIITDGCGSSNKIWVNSGTLDFSNADVTFTCANDIEFSGTGLASGLKLDVADMLILQGDFAFRSASSEDITGGTIKLGGSLSVYSGADFTPSGGIFVFDSGSEAKIAGEVSPTFYNMTIDKTNATVTLSLPLTVGNDLIINAGTLDANDHDIFVAGDWTNNDTFNPGDGTVTFNGSGSQTIYTGGIGPNTTFNNLKIDGSSVNVNIAGFVQISGNFAIEKSTDTFSTGGNEIHIAGNWTNNGTFNHDGGTVFFEGLSVVDSGGTGLGKAFYNLELNGSGITLSNNALDLDGNLNFSSSATLDANGSNIRLEGHWNAGETTHTFNPGGGTVIFDGSGSQTISPAANTFHHMKIDGAADVTVTITGFLQLSGDFAIEKVTDTFSTGGNDMKVAGNWTNNGTFIHDGATLSLDGSGSFGPGSDPFDDLIVSSGTRSLTGSELTVDGKLTITSTGTLQATTGGLDIYTGEGGVTDVDIDGNLTLQLGAATGDINWHVRKNSVVDIDPCATVILDGFDSSNRIKLQSSTEGLHWYMNDHTSDANIPSVDNVTVTDSDASSGETILASGGTNTLTRTINWLRTTTFVVYTDYNAPGNNDGSSWTDAYKYLQDALSDANTSGKDIWVAAGSYKPDVNTSNAPGSGDREATFQLSDGLTIYGGFPPGGGTWEDRDPNIYNTILTGDLDGNDVGEPNHPSRGENSYHVVTGADNATIDGFTITGGNANASDPYNKGAGLFLPEVTNMVVVNNNITANIAGANSLETYYGGGIHLDSPSPLSIAPNIIRNCTITDNHLEAGVSGFGSGIALLPPMSPSNAWSVFMNNKISGNSSGGGPCYGGGIAIRSNSSSQVVIKDNNISDNDANYGGGIYHEDEGSISSPPLIINNNFISNNFADYGGGVYSGVHLAISDIRLINCILRGNEAYYDGGGAFAEPNVNLAATNCVFSENSTTTGDGGGFYADSNATFTATNCTIVSNSAANLGGGGRHLIGSPFNNCIFWQNIDSTGSGESAQISGTGTMVSHSCIQGWTGGGPGNISTDPFLADIPDQVRLLSISPCIDAGDNSLVPADCADLDDDGDTLEPTSFDIVGRSRFVDSLARDRDCVDMGAYEHCSTYCGDFDSDRYIEFHDFAKLAGAWSTQEGDPKFNSAYDISTPQDNSIDMLDLDVFTDNWLTSVPSRVLHSAVIVGISDYNDIPDVNFGAEDANDWYSYFCNLGYEDIWVYGDNNAGGYPRYDGLATEINIKTAIQNMVNSAEANDAIAFVFSGHGDGDGVGNYWLCAWDSNSGMYGEDGALYDYELRDLFQSAKADRIFIFLDSCLSGGMGDDLMAMPNAANVYATTTCDPNGCRGEEPAYSNGAWNYWFLEAGLIGQYSSDPNTTMEECFIWADTQYNPGGEDEPMEFDGDPCSTFTLW